MAVSASLCATSFGLGGGRYRLVASCDDAAARLFAALCCSFHRKNSRNRAASSDSLRSCLLARTAWAGFARTAARAVCGAAGALANAAIYQHLRLVARST